MASESFKMEYMKVLPEFTGEQSSLADFIGICESLISKFYDPLRPDDFNNFLLVTSIKNKIKGDAAKALSSYTFTTWLSLKEALLATYADKRDLETLTIELCNLRQNKLRPLEFFSKVQENLNYQISFIRNKIDESKKNVLVEQSQKLALRIFLKHLNNPLGEYLSTRKPSTLNEAMYILTNDYNINTGQDENVNRARPLVKYSQHSPSRPNPQHFPNKTNPQHFQFRQPLPKTSLNPHPNEQTPRQYKPTPMSIVTSNVKPNTYLHRSFDRGGRSEALPRVEEMHFISDDNRHTDTNETCPDSYQDKERPNLECNEFDSCESDPYFLGEMASETPPLNC